MGGWVGVGGGGRCIAQAWTSEDIMHRKPGWFNSEKIINVSVYDRPKLQCMPHNYGTCMQLFFACFF